MIINKKTKKIMQLNTITFLKNGYLNFNQFNLLMQAIKNGTVNPCLNIKDNLDMLTNKQ